LFWQIPDDILSPGYNHRSVTHTTAFLLNSNHAWSVLHKSACVTHGFSSTAAMVSQAVFSAT